MNFDEDWYLKQVIVVIIIQENAGLSISQIQLNCLGKWMCETNKTEIYSKKTISARKEIEHGILMKIEEIIDIVHRICSQNSSWEGKLRYKSYTK